MNGKEIFFKALLIIHFLYEVELYAIIKLYVIVLYVIGILNCR